MVFSGRLLAGLSLGFLSALFASSAWGLVELGGVRWIDLAWRIVVCWLSAVGSPISLDSGLGLV